MVYSDYIDMNAICRVIHESVHGMEKNKVKSLFWQFASIYAIDEIHLKYSMLNAFAYFVNIFIVTWNICSDDFPKEIALSNPLCLAV